MTQLDAEPDSLWRHPATRTLWRRTVGEFLAFAQVSGKSIKGGFLESDDDDDRAVIADLVQARGRAGE